MILSVVLDILLFIEYFMLYIEKPNDNILINFLVISSILVVISLLSLIEGFILHLRTNEKYAIVQYIYIVFLLLFLLVMITPSVLFEVMSYAQVKLVLVCIFLLHLFCIYVDNKRNTYLSISLSQVFLQMTTIDEKVSNKKAYKDFQWLSKINLGYIFMYNLYNEILYKRVTIILYMIILLWIYHRLQTYQEHTGGWKKEYIVASICCLFMFIFAYYINGIMVIVAISLIEFPIRMRMSNMLKNENRMENNHFR